MSADSELANYAPELRKEFLAEITEAVAHAYEKHGDDQWGRHEFYAILKEEVDELWEAIKRDDPQDVVREELLQVACVCLRYYETGDRYRETLRPISPPLSLGPPVGLFAESDNGVVTGG